MCDRLSGQPNGPGRDRSCDAAAVTEPDRPDTGGVPALSRRTVLAVPWLAGAVALVGCTEAEGPDASSTAPDSTTSAVRRPELDAVLLRELALLDWAESLTLSEAQRVLGAHVDALRAAGALGALDGAPTGPRTAAAFVRALDLAADQTQRAVTEPESGSDAALLASIAASDAALAASLRGTRG